MKLIPQDARVIVKPIEEETVRASGIVVPDVAKKKPVRGTIIAVGAGAQNEDGKRIPLEFSEGEIVIYDRYSGLDYKPAGGDELVILRAHDVLAVEMPG